MCGLIAVSIPGTDNIEEHWLKGGPSPPVTSTGCPLLPKLSPRPVILQCRLVDLLQRPPTYVPGRQVVTHSSSFRQDHCCCIRARGISEALQDAQHRQLLRFHAPPLSHPHN